MYASQKLQVLTHRTLEDFSGLHSRVVSKVNAGHFNDSFSKKGHPTDSF